MGVALEGWTNFTLSGTLLDDTPGNVQRLKGNGHERMHCGSDAWGSFAGSNDSHASVRGVDLLDRGLAGRLMYRASTVA